MQLGGSAGCSHIKLCEDKMSKREEVVWFILNHPELVEEMDRVLKILEMQPVETLIIAEPA